MELDCNPGLVELLASSLGVDGVMMSFCHVVCQPWSTLSLYHACSRAWVMVIMMKFVQAFPQYYYILCSAVLLLLVGLSAACCGVNCPLVCLAFTWFKKALSLLQAGVSWLRFNCAKAAFNGASKLVVTPLGRWKLSIVLISFCIAWVGVITVQRKVAALGSVFPWVSAALTLNVFAQLSSCYS